MVNKETTDGKIKESTMTKEQKEDFINNHKEIVPRNQKNKFENLSIDDKIKKIYFFIDMKKMKEEENKKNKLENKIKDLFIKRKVTTAEVLKVIDFCKQYIEGTKQEEIKKIQLEIERLTNLKSSLETN